MIVDKRTYSIAPGLLADYLGNHLDVALRIMRQHIGEPFAYFTTDTGDLNQFVHLCRYDDHTDRERPERRCMPIRNSSPTARMSGSVAGFCTSTTACCARCLFREPREPPD